jgi:hypothetical protein
MSNSAAASQNVPYPPRFWWLKRLALAGVALILGLLLLRAWWGHHASRLLAAEHERLRAAGEPVVPEDLNPQPIPANQNAATFLSRAIAVVARSTAHSPSQSALEYVEYPPYPAEWHELANASVASNAAALPLLRQARAHPASDWGGRFSSPAVAPMPPALNWTRGLAMFGADAVLLEHLRGNDAAALELARDVRHVAASRTQEPVLMSHLVAMGIEALAAHRLKLIAPALEVTRGEDFPVGAAIPDGPATRGQVEALIAELLGPPPPGTGVVVALRGERVLTGDMVGWMTRGNWLLEPLFRIEQGRVIERYEQCAVAATRPTLAGVRAAMPATSDGGAGRLRLSTLISSRAFPSVDGFMTQHLRIETERYFAAVSLAVRLYRLDHGGAWPTSLDALVPAYLPAVPADPFSPSGAPLGYLLARGALPWGGVRPIVYSVADNGTDETASGAMALSPEPRYGWERGDDQQRDLSRWAPLPDLGKLGRALLGIDDSAPASTIEPMPEWYGSTVEDEDDPAGGADDDGRAETRPAGAPAATTSPQALDHQPDEAHDPGQHD